MEYIETDLKQIGIVPKTNADRIELYTESYANTYSKDQNKAITPFIESAKLANSLAKKE